MENEDNFYKEQLFILHRRLRASAKEAEKEGDERREIALLRVCADVGAILKGENINYNPPEF